MAYRSPWWSACSRGAAISQYSSRHGVEPVLPPGESLWVYSLLRRLHHYHYRRRRHNHHMRISSAPISQRTYRCVTVYYGKTRRLLQNRKCINILQRHRRRKEYDRMQRTQRIRCCSDLGRVVLEICSRTDTQTERQTNRRTHHSISLPSKQ